MTYRTLAPGEHRQVVSDMTVSPWLKRLARLGVHSYELGVCEHGPAAKCRAQVGRAEKTFAASHCEAPSAYSPAAFAEALEALGDAIETDRRGKLRGIGPVSTG